MAAGALEHETLPRRFRAASAPLPRNCPQLSPSCSWGQLGDSWGQLGDSWGQLGDSWGHLGDSWGQLGDSWGQLGDSWGQPKINPKLFT